jgi:hypothetical protein
VCLFYLYLSFVLLIQKTLYRTELALDNSGISVAPPKRLRSTTTAIPSQPSITTSRARRSDAKSKKLEKEMSSDEDDESEDENNDKGKENEDKSESNEDNESESNESSDEGDENGHQKSQNNDNDDKETDNVDAGACVATTNTHFGKMFQSHIVILLTFFWS